MKRYVSERIGDDYLNWQVGRNVLISTPTGSGKTTQLPLILHEAGYSENGVIGVTQPRRIAALSVTEYINKQLDSTIKAEKMQEWWSKAHELLIGLGLKRSDIVDAVAQSDIRIRDDSVALINYCRENQIPFLLFSAGLGDVLAVVSLHGSH